MFSTLLVFVGAGIGGVARHGVNLAAARWLGAGFPFSTLAVNVAGSVLMGLLAGWLALRAGEGWSQSARLFLATGVLGGFTTFSAFSLDAVLLWERGETGAFILYLAASVGLSVLGLVAGLTLVRSVS